MMPPLPESNHLHYSTAAQKDVLLYTQKQMLAYGRAVAEAKDAEVAALRESVQGEGYLRAAIAERYGTIEALRAEVERERIRLAACGVIAQADTPKSAQAARKMHDDYKSASCDAVAVRVDECMRLRAEVAALRAALDTIATTVSSDWPERCQENVRIARAALAAKDKA